LDGFDEEQMQRYEAYRRAGLPKPVVKKYLSSVLGCAVQPSTTIVVAGAAKIFIGELTEKSLDIMKERGDTGPICPHHLREAYQSLKDGDQKTKKKPRRRRLFR
jgi:transcription initiation factor TFIID subunit 11